MLAFSSCSEQGVGGVGWGVGVGQELLLIAVCGFPIAVVSLVGEHGSMVHGLSSYGVWIQLPSGMWDLPGLGIKPVSPALASGFFTTGPPGNSQRLLFLL